MLKPISRLRLVCKDNLNNIFNSYIVQRFRKRLCNTIPVLSIFALIGIVGYSIGLLNSAFSFGEVDGKVYAADSGSSTSSLIIDNGTASDSAATVRGGVAYSSHTVQVIANNIEGYSLKITGPTNMTGPTTISGVGNNIAPANMANNTWGYGWNTTSTTNANMTYNSFTGSTQTLENNTTTAITNNAVDITRKLVFAAKFGDNATSGHYRANVKLNLAVTPKAVTGDYSIQYNLNGGTGGPTNTSVNTDDPSYKYTVPTTKPTKTGYTFQGWSNNNSFTIHYNPGDTITLTTTNPNIVLYAMWKLSSFPDSLTTMQGMTVEICDSVTVGASKTLSDSRDANSYAIRKLTDNKCWMADNLKLDLSSVTLTSSNSNVSSTYTKGTAANVTTRAGWQFTSDPQFSMNGIGNSSYKSGSGYHYNWFAATAGSGTASTSSGAATYSICPKGWRLPSGGSSGDFQILYNKFDSATWDTVNGLSGRWLGAASATAGGAHFPTTGYIVSSGLDLPTSSGCYWSRTARTVSVVYGLYFTGSQGNISPSTGNMAKTEGATVRCVAYSS